MLGYPLSIVYQGHLDDVRGPKVRAQPNRKCFSAAPKDMLDVEISSLGDVGMLRNELADRTFTAGQITEPFCKRATNARNTRDV